MRAPLLPISVAIDTECLSGSGLPLAAVGSRGKRVSVGPTLSTSTTMRASVPGRLDLVNDGFAPPRKRSVRASTATSSSRPCAAPSSRACGRVSSQRQAPFDEPDHRGHRATTTTSNRSRDVLLARQGIQRDDRRSTRWSTPVDRPSREESRLLLRRLDQRHPCIRSNDRQWNARHATTGADVGECMRPGRGRNGSSVMHRRCAAPRRRRDR